MVAISQTFNQRDNNNNGKDNDKTDAAANVAPLDVDEKSHWAQFAAPGPLATPSNVDAETIADAARAGVDETPDAESDVESTKRPEETNETPKRPGLGNALRRRRVRLLAPERRRRGRRACAVRRGGVENRRSRRARRSEVEPVDANFNASDAASRRRYSPILSSVRSRTCA